MCGIIGYVGTRTAKPLLLQGLERLEYRGYDSAGIALREDDALDYVRAVGNLQELKRTAGDNGSLSTHGLGHTRWATHGAVTEFNAHPLTGCEDGRLAIVLNGIVENYRELKESLVADGHTFSSQTDAEVVAHLVERHYQGDLVEAVRKTYAELEGHFSFVVIHHDHPDLLVGARYQTPLVVGVGDGEMFLASSIAAFLAETRLVQLIDDGDIVAITPQGAEFHRDGEIVEPDVIEVDWDDESAEKGGYETFMLKEIYEQAESVRETIGDRARQEPAAARGDRPHRARDPEPAPHRDRRVRHRVPRRRRRPLHHRGVGAAPGRARHRERVDLPQPGALEGHARDRHLAVGRDARHRERDQARQGEGRADARDHEPDGDADHARGRCGAVHALRPRGRRRRVKDVHVPGRVAVAPALRLAQVRKTLPDEEMEFIVDHLNELPNKIREFLDGDHPIEEIAKRFYEQPFFLYLGRHIGLPVALEGALKLKEISYIPTEAYSAGEMKHGPIALLEEGTPVVVVATNIHVYDKIVSNIQETRARGAHVIAIATDGNEDIQHHADDVIYVPRTANFLQAILAVIPLQLLAYRIARLRGLNVDQPRNLAKTVTVE